MARTRSFTTRIVDTPVLYVVGIDVGADTCAVCILRTDKTAIRSPFTIANAAPGFARLAAVLEQLGCSPAQIVSAGVELTQERR
jgi:hypothetical protein